MAAPPTPAAPTAAARYNNALKLNVTAVAGALRYSWRISTDSSITDDDRTEFSDGVSITVTGLESDTAYWIDVRAGNDDGDSGWSADLAASTTEPDATVSSLTLNVPADNPDGAMLWRYLPYAPSSEQPSAGEPVIEGRGGRVTIHPLQPGNTYRISHRTPDDPQWSASFLATTGGIALPPTDPREIFRIGQTATELILSTRAFNATHYSWRIDGGRTVTSESDVRAADSRVILSDLEPDTEYSIDVMAHNSAGDGSGRSPARTFRTALATPTPEVTGITGDTIAVSLTEEIPGADSHIWRYSADGEPTDDDPFIWTVSAHAVLDGLDPDTEYHISVKAQNYDNESGYSPALSVKTP